MPIIPKPLDIILDQFRTLHIRITTISLRSNLISSSYVLLYLQIFIKISYTVWQMKHAVKLYIMDDMIIFFKEWMKTPVKIEPNICSSKMQKVDYSRHRRWKFFK
jgi:hypothetical protein